MSVDESRVQLFLSFVPKRIFFSTNTNKRSFLFSRQSRKTRVAFVPNGFTVRFMVSLTVPYYHLS